MAEQQSGGWRSPICCVHANTFFPIRRAADSNAGQCHKYMVTLEIFYVQQYETHGYNGREKVVDSIIRTVCIPFKPSSSMTCRRGISGDNFILISGDDQKKRCSLTACNIHTMPAVVCNMERVDFYRTFDGIPAAATSHHSAVVSPQFDLLSSIEEEAKAEEEQELDMECDSTGGEEAEKQEEEEEMMVRSKKNKRKRARGEWKKSDGISPVAKEPRLLPSPRVVPRPVNICGRGECMPGTVPTACKALVDCGMVNPQHVNVNKGDQINSW